MKRISVIIAAVTGIFYSIAAAGIHDPWDKILSTYVEDGMVDYSGLKNNQDDMKILDVYIASLAKEGINKKSREEKLAFWINAYNAFTIKLILNHFPVKSIRDIKNPWKQKTWTAAEEKLSLDDIEHKRLRAELKEPRIHFAIVCASIGCPNIDNKAFKAVTLEKHLNQRAKTFFTFKKNFYLEKEGATVSIFVSSIMKWFAGDFGKNKEERIAFMLAYADQATANKIKSAGRTKVIYLDYDWSLNGS